MFEYTMWIYILACAHGKYYVGRTTTKDRIQMHFDGNGSAWTKIHKPYKKLLVVKGDKFDEDKYVFKYMEKYGIQNVRGGCFSQVVLPDDKIKMIETILTGVDDRCFRCGESGHFINDCPEERVQENEEVETQESEWVWGFLRCLISSCFPKKSNDYVELNDLSNHF